VLADLAPLLLGALLGWAGLAKLADRTAPEPDTALMRLLHDARLVTGVLRALGAVEVGLAAVLLVRPLWTVGGGAAAVLGAGFVGYLAWARAVAPGSSCGCTGGRSTPVTGRSFARAGLVVAGGLAATTATTPWWTVLADRPAAAGALLAAGVLLLAALSGDVDERWLLPLRRARLRLLGSPLAGPAGGPAAGGGAAPVAVSVELLEHSLAWEATAPVIRSALLEHWDTDGWRFLRFAGVSDGRPVDVVYALAADATLGAGDPVVRVTVVDPDRQEVLPTAL
jgi:hypothetical protein